MKRNLDRIRGILIEIENAKPLQDLQYEGDEDFYQIKLLLDAGVGVAEVYENDATAYGERMTSRGHDFLDSIRDNTIWMKVKKHVNSTVGSVALSVLSDVAAGFARGKLGLL